MEHDIHTEVASTVSSGAGVVLTEGEHGHLDADAARQEVTPYGIDYNDPDHPVEDGRRTPIRCLACGIEGMRSFEGPGELPDPNRYGDRELASTCPGCGERVIQFWSRHGGTSIDTPGFEYVEPDDR